jgi:SAM-dependent methyltransferase
MEVIGAEEMRCPDDGLSFKRVDNIWRCLLPEREPIFTRFVQEYETVRRGEDRGSDDPAYYRALPFADLSGRMTVDWHIRAQSFSTFLEKILMPLEIEKGSPLKILDLGSGNGWLSYQLARRGHDVAAVDLATNRCDGLGAHAMYGVDFLPIQAEFDRLPLSDDQADIVVFNASLHYATNYVITLLEAWRVTAPGGLVAVVDTAVYHNPASGDQMVRERERLFQQKYGFPSNAIPSQNYLTYSWLATLAQQLNVNWQLIWPVPAWRRTVRRLRAGLRGQREPAQFPLILGQKVGQRA